MKRWFVHLFIASYLSALGIGIVCHTFSFGLAVHPAMYYVVWDMFCGWSAYESRMQIIGEGESGTYYELSPAPWGDFRPYGSLGRRHYDTFAAHGARLGLNAVRHTRHEPITKILVIEENHAKKYNLSDAMYERLYGEAKEMVKYYHVRNAITPEGRVLSVQPSWLTVQFSHCLTDNPRLQADTRRHRPVYTLSPDAAIRRTLAAGSFVTPSQVVPGDSPLGN